MRYLFGFLCVFALCVVPLVGCAETQGGGEGGSGGSAGTGGMAGNGGVGGVGGMLPSAVIPYDRTDRFAMWPFPDDFWLSPDASTPTGSRFS